MWNVTHASSCSRSQRQAAHIVIAAAECGKSSPYIFLHLAYHHVAPATGESRDAVVSLDALAALAAASVAIALHPVVQEISAALWFLRFDIGVDAAGRCMLHATLVHRVLANCKRNTRGK